MAINAKQKAALREKESNEEKKTSTYREQQNRCTCLVAIRGRGQHAIDCALSAEEDGEDGPCPRCGGDHSWCQMVQPGEFG